MDIPTEWYSKSVYEIERYCFYCYDSRSVFEEDIPRRTLQIKSDERFRGNNECDEKHKCRIEPLQKIGRIANSPNSEDVYDGPRENPITENIGCRY
jgi:hypothetical protein